MAYGFEGAAIKSGIGRGLEKATTNILNMYRLKQANEALRINADAAKQRAASQAKMADAYVRHQDQRTRMAAFGDAAIWNMTSAPVVAPTTGKLPTSGPSTPLPHQSNGMSLARPHPMAFSTPKVAPPADASPPEARPGAAGLLPQGGQFIGPPEFIKVNNKPMYSDFEG